MGKPWQHTLSSAPAFLPTNQETDQLGSRPPPANICYEYATKRYRSNCINWGILPFTLGPDTAFDYEPGDCIFVPEVRQAVVQGKEEIPAKVIRQDGTVRELLLHLKGLTQNEKEIILDGCLMNYYAARNKE